MTANANANANANARERTALPRGWVIRVSRSKGRVFYYHTTTGATQWTRPEGGNEDNGDGGNADRVVVPMKSDTSRNQSKRLHYPAEIELPEPSTKKKKKECVATATPMGGQLTGPSPEHAQRRASIKRCMRVGGTHGDQPFVPWEHQISAVEKLLDAIECGGVRTPDTAASKFLLQHSTGSGKTMTIAALTHQLLYLVDARKQRFHTVVLLIDRIKLDEQVGDLVETFLRRNGFDAVFRAASIDHLAHLLAPPRSVISKRGGNSHQASPLSSQRVIITTIQKMGLLAKNAVLLTRLLHGNSADDDDNLVEQSAFTRVAIITDEAHRSHTATTRHTIETIMMAGENNGKNSATFVGFTATPNSDSLELFGSRGLDGALRPFHCYSMAQAVADGRVMHVLEHYTTVRCEVETSVPPAVLNQLREERTLRAVIDVASEDLAVLKAKSLRMMSDYEQAKGAWIRSKCMIVTRSRRDVVRYYQLLSTYIKNRKRPWRAFACFSGTVALEDSSGLPNTFVTEQTINVPDVTLAISDIVIVCDKLDTGYSDPLLQCMYIDRYLRSSTQTVQLLSRLNRRHKDKRCVRIVDFANHAAQIRQHFASFWGSASIPGDSDVIDVQRTVREFRTCGTIVCDFITPWALDREFHKVAADWVDDAVQSLDRDAFQQIVDSLGHMDSMWNRLRQHGEENIASKSFPLSSELLEIFKDQLDKHVAPHATTSSTSPLTVEAVITKMTTRVRRYVSQYSGAILPDGLLTEIRNWKAGDLPNEAVGSLEEFEYLLEQLAHENLGTRENLDLTTTEQRRAGSGSRQTSDVPVARLLHHVETIRDQLERKSVHSSS